MLYHYKDNGYKDVDFFGGGGGGGLLFNILGGKGLINLLQFWEN